MRALLPLLILAALAAGCTERPRANPFDPANPATEGRPAGFAAVAGDREVRLAWLPAPAGADAGFRLYRRLEGETAFVPITGDLPGTASGVGDFGALNGRRHEYRLYYLFGGQLGGDPAEDHATPGPTRPWVADLGRRLLSRLSADGRRVASSAGGYFGPTAVAYDRDRQRVWVADTYDGRVVALANDLTLRVTIAGLSEPVAIALDSLNGDLWVCDQARDAVYHYDLDGNPRGPTSLPGIDTPISVAVDPQDGSLWVCERGGDRVRRYTRAGTPNGFITLTAPSRVAVDSLSRDAWVTSFDTGLAVRIAPGAGIQDTVAFQGPIGVAVDGRRGRIWIADARAGQVVALRRSGVVEFTVGGLTRVREVTVDPRTGDGWATVPGTGEVVHIGGAGAATGQVLARAGGFGDPYGIAVDPGQ